MIMLIFLSSCGTYYRNSNSGITFVTHGDFGLTHEESVQNQANMMPGVSSVLNSKAGGGRNIKTAEASQSSISFSDGTIITGPINHSAHTREIGNAIKNVKLIQGVKSIWLKLLSKLNIE